jgi:hypothetical protein
MLIDFTSEKEWVYNVFKKFSFQKFYKIISLKKEPIIIAGCGRSGTSLLLSVLSAHPNIYGISKESNIFGYPRKFNSSYLNRINNYRKLIPYLLEDDKILTSKRWCEKTPRNIRFIDLISKEFKNKVKIIHIVRDGRDVITSIHPQTNEYHIPIGRWVNDVSSGLRFQNSENLLLIKYEDLINDYKGTLFAILSFIGEEYDVALENFQANTNVKKHDAYSGRNVREINSSSVNKWKEKKYESRIKKFYENENAIHLLKELGYEI